MINTMKLDWLTELVREGYRDDRLTNYEQDLVARVMFEIADNGRDLRYGPVRWAILTKIADKLDLMTDW